MAKITNINILSTFRKQVGISKVDEIAFVEAFQSIFEEALLRDKIVKISGLGTFKLIPVESRKSVNVNTGEEIEIAGHYKLTFTPDALLRDKVNEPLAHLETTELDVDVVIENQAEIPTAVSKEDLVERQEVEHSQDDPLQKLTEQALELKDILADIQGLGEQAKIQLSSDLSDQSDQLSSPQERISARDIVAAINQEDTAPNNKYSKGWIWVAIILFVAIIGLLGYQNRNFFLTSDENYVETPIIADFSNSSDLSDLSDSSDSSDPSDPSDLSDLSDLSDPSDNFSDLFNQKREYTEFIDTVTLNEGSRLTWIALKHLGHKDYWVYIYEANRDIVKNPNSIKIGTKLRIPKLAPELIDVNNLETIEYARYLHDIYVKK